MTETANPAKRDYAAPSQHLSSEQRPIDSRPISQGAMRFLLPIGLTIAASISLFARFHAGPGFLAFYEDDFFYYLRVAQHIAAGNHSTFDGTHLTNGYHPLWMLVLVALTWLFGTGISFFYALQCVILLSVLATYVLAERTLRAFAPAAAWIPQLLAVALATSTLVLAGGAMEIVVAVPLLAGLICYRLCRFAWTPWRAFILGLLAGALVLARLDAAILVTVMATLDFLLASDVSLSQRMRCALAFLGGASPVAAYLALNERWFHTLMPVSGQAKQMRFHHWPSTVLFNRNVFGLPQRFFVVYPLLLASVAGLVLLPILCRRPALRGRAACLLAALLFPFLYVATLSILTDWPIWPWYLYPLIGSGLGSAALVTAAIADWQDNSGQRLLTIVRWPAVALLLLVWIAFGLAQWRNSTRPDKLGFSAYLTAIDIARFGQSHPGVYAMGDHAGTPGYLLDRPLVQLEGLVMDRPFLENIRAQRPLATVLRDYDVRYYIASNAIFRNSCWMATEPLAAGSDSPHMRGVFCMQPLVQFQHSSYHTLIFDLAAEPGSPTTSK
jgi:hypothetical protein